jgi:hypothetical protein
LSYIDCSGINQGTITFDSATNPTTIQGGQMKTIYASGELLIEQDPINNTPIKSAPYTGNLNFAWCYILPTTPPN